MTLGPSSSPHTWLRWRVQTLKVSEQNRGELKDDGGDLRNWSTCMITNMLATCLNKETVRMIEKRRGKKLESAKVNVLAERISASKNGVFSSVANFKLNKWIPAGSQKYSSRVFFPVFHGSKSNFSRCHFDFFHGIIYRFLTVFLEYFLHDYLK